MKEKVLIYVIRFQNEIPHILVFDHRAYPEVSPQVPAGTIEPNEEPIDAAIRELEEESGINMQRHDAIGIGRFKYFKEDIAEYQNRNCFLFLSENSPDHWEHKVTCGEEDKGYYFDYHWISVLEASEKLKGQMGDYFPSFMISNDFYKVCQTLQRQIKECCIERIEFFKETPESFLFVGLQKKQQTILKIMKPHTNDGELTNLVMENVGSSTFPKILNHSENTILMERLAGEPLSLYPTGAKETSTIFVNTSKPMHGIKEHIAKIDSLRHRTQSLMNCNHSLIDVDLLSKAKAICNHLLETEKNRCLLHGDLHHGNIIGSQKLGWKLIDPKPIYGEQLYDFANSFYNPIERLEEISKPDYISGLAKQYAILTRDPETRVLEWAFVHGVLSCIWFEEDGLPWDHRIPVIKGIERLLM